MSSPQTEAPASDPVSLEAALLAGKKVGPDAVGHLMDDHRKAEAYFRAYTDASDVESRTAIAERLCESLLVHMLLEEQLFYPVAREETGEDELVDRAFEEHGQAKKLIDQIREAGTADAAGLVKQLQAIIEEHVRTEEERLFPEVQASDIDLYDVGQDLVILQAEALSEVTGKPLPGEA